MDETKERQDMSDELTSQEFVERHKQFKLKAAEVMHEFANEREFCMDFDFIIGRLGLPVREQHRNYVREYYDDVTVSPDDVVGEDTVEAFETWKRDTGRALVIHARRHMIQDYRSALEEAGFPVPVTREVRIEGRFTVTQTVETFEDEDVIDAVDASRLREDVYTHFGTDHVTWKAVDPNI